MTHEDCVKFAGEIARIKGLPLEQFFKMRGSTIERLTSGFFEPLVRLIFAKTTDADQQRNLVEYMEEALEEAGGFTVYPGYDEPEEYLDNFRFEIDCGSIVTEEGYAPDPILVAPPPSPVNKNSICVSALHTKKITNKDDNVLKEKGSFYVNTGNTVDDPDEKERLIERIHELEKLLEEERQKNQGIDDLPELDEVQKTTLHQKIVFFTTVTSVLLDKRYTNMRNLASFIASMCNEKPSTIAPMLSRIGQISDDNPNPNLSATLNSAAQCVSDMLLQILTDETRHDKSQIINKIRKDLLLNYPLPEDK